MAYAVMIKFALKFEEQKAMLVWANLNLFVCGLEIETGADEGAACVLAVRGKAQIRGHREADLFWQVAPRVRGSLLSAKTTLSFPTATPFGHRA